MGKTSPLDVDPSKYATVQLGCPVGLFGKINACSHKMVPKPRFLLATYQDRRGPEIGITPGGIVDRFALKHTGGGNMG